MVYELTHSRADLEMTRRELKEVNHAVFKAHEERLVLQNALAEASEAFSKEIRDSKRLADNTIAKYVADGKRLRVKLASKVPTKCSTGSDSRQELDGRAELHGETATALVGIAQDADAHVRALQETVRILQRSNVENE